LAGAPIGLKANHSSGSYISVMAAKALSRWRRWPFSTWPSLGYPLTALLIGGAPWVTFLFEKFPLAHTFGDFLWPVLLALVGARFVWKLLTGPERVVPPVLELLMVLAAVCAFQGFFAQLYWAIAQTPDAFTSEPLNTPHQLSRGDIAFFTISTATNAGAAQIFAKSDPAKIAVTAQVVSNLFIVVGALGFAFNRLVSLSSSDRSDAASPTAADEHSQGAHTAESPAADSSG
jgi:hypothetical protein